MPAVPPARQDDPFSDPHHTPSDQGRRPEPEHRPELEENSASAADPRPEPPVESNLTLGRVARRLAEACRQGELNDLH